MTKNVEASRQIKNGNVLKFLKDYWFLVLFIIGAAYAWAEMKGSTIQTFEGLIRVEAKVETNTISLNEIKIKYASDIATMKTDIEHIKDFLIK